MTTARAAHTATLLEAPACHGSSRPDWCGKVLVAGGYADGSNTAAAVASAELFDPANKTWSATGSLRDARRSHTATLLPDGKVLVTGGSRSGLPSSPSDPSQDVTSAELYDPSQGTWSASASMRQGGPGQAATLLDGPACRQTRPASYCGNVVVVSQRYSVSGMGTPSADVYDERQGTWSATGPILSLPAPSTLLTEPATTLLDGPACHESAGTPTWCGDVLLVASGAYAFLFDPVTGTWRPTAPLPHARHGFSTVALPDGRVLVTGGRIVTPPSNVNPPTADEIYDPRTGTWALTPNTMNTTRAHQTAIVLTGSSCGQHCGQVFAAGGEAFPELYDVGRSAWSRARARVTPRVYHTSTLLEDGEVLVTGGVPFALTGIPSLAPTKDAELWNPVVPAPSPPGTQTRSGWSLTGSLNDNHFQHTATLLDGPACRKGSAPHYCGEVLVLGGNQTGSAELYDPTTGRWTRAGHLLVARSEHTATLLHDGRVLVAGGLVGRRDQKKATETATAEIYDPATQSSTPTAPLAFARFEHTATLLDDGRVLVAGGASGGGVTVPMNTSELFDAATGTWAPTGRLTDARAGHTATFLLNGQVLVAGGLGTLGTPGQNTVLYSAELYDPLNGNWSLTAAMQTPRYGHTAAVLDKGACALNCGKVLIVGGLTLLDGKPGNPVSTASAELFDPNTNTWSGADPMRVARDGQSETTLHDGKVLVAGGGSGSAKRGTLQTFKSTVLFDPATGHWIPLSDLITPDGGQTATVLEGSACDRVRPPRYCGMVLLAGGQTIEGYGFVFPATEEIFREAR